jgi:hypothetical protein
MPILDQPESTFSAERTEPGAAGRLFVGFLCALLASGGILGGYLYLRHRHSVAIELKEAQKSQTRPVLPPKVEARVDDAMLKDHEIRLGGTVQNISNEALRGITIQLELRRRSNGGLETKTMALDPSDLGPNDTGRYSLTVSAKDYSTARLSRIEAGNEHAEIPFRTVPGAQRPPEPPPQSKAIVIKRSPSKGEFLNSPENPVHVP